MATLNRSAEVWAGKEMGFSRPSAFVCFNSYSSFIRNDSSRHWEKQLGRCGTFPGQDKSPKPVRSAHSRNRKAGVKLKPYEQRRLCSPSKSLAVFQLTLKQVFETQSFFYMVECGKTTTAACKTKGNKAVLLCACQHQPLWCMQGAALDPFPIQPL